MESNPLDQIKAPRKPKAKRDALNNDELKKLVTLNYEDTLEGYRDRALINLKLVTGLRDVSISRLCINDITKNEGKILLYYKAKGTDNADNFVVLTEKVYSYIQKYLLMRDAKPNDFIFVSVSDRNFGSKLTTQGIRLIIHRLLKRAKIERSEITSNSIRHTCFSVALENGCNIAQVKELAGHKSIKTTASYIHDRNRILNPAEESIANYLE